MRAINRKKRPTSGKRLYAYLGGRTGEAVSACEDGVTSTPSAALACESRRTHVVRRHVLPHPPSPTTTSLRLRSGLRLGGSWAGSG